MGKKRHPHQLSFGLDSKIDALNCRNPKVVSQNKVVHLGARRDELVRKELIDQFDRSGIGRLRLKRK